MLPVMPFLEWPNARLKLLKKLVVIHKVRNPIL